MPQFANRLGPPIRAFRDLQDEDETTADHAADGMPDDSEEVIFSEQKCSDQVLETRADNFDRNDSPLAENLDLSLDSAVRLVDQSSDPPRRLDSRTLPAVPRLEQMDGVKERLPEIKRQLRSSD
jgi:hypothetical protein